MGDVCNACVIERLASAELGDTAAGEASALRASFIVFGSSSWSWSFVRSLREWNSLARAHSRYSAKGGRCHLLQKRLFEVGDQASNDAGFHLSEHNESYHSKVKYTLYF